MEKLFPALSNIRKITKVKTNDKELIDRLWYIEFIPPQDSQIGKRKVETNHSIGMAATLNFLKFAVLDSFQGYEPKQFENAFILLLEKAVKDEDAVKKAIVDRLYDKPEILFPFLSLIRNEKLVDVDKGMWLIEFPKDANTIRRQREQLEMISDFLKVLKIDMYNTYPGIEMPSDGLIIKIKKGEKSAKSFIAHTLAKDLDKYVPRYLEEHEIDDVLNVLPIVKSFDKASSRLAMISLKETMRLMIEPLKLVPFGIPALKREMLRQYENSLIGPGTSVGASAAESMGRPVVQSNLNTFHAAGTSKNMAGGIELIQRILNITDKQKFDSSTIHFKNKLMTFDGVLKKRQEIVGITIQTLLLSSEVDLYSAFEHFFWEEMYPFIMNKQIEHRPDDTTMILRLKFNISKLYVHKVSLEDIARTLENQQKHSIVCLCSPLYQGIIDVYAIEDVVEGELKRYKIDVNKSKLEKSVITTLFLDKIVRANLPNIPLKGIQKITALFPVPLPILKIVDTDKPYYSADELAKLPPQLREEQKRIYYLLLRDNHMTESGIGIENVVQLLSVCKIAISKIVYQPHNRPSRKLLATLREASIQLEETQKHTDYLIVSMPDDVDGSPVNYIKQLINKDQEDEDEYESNAKKQGIRLFRRPPSEIKKAAYYYIAETNGNNLRELMMRDDVDTTRTTSNNFKEVYEVLGIEATRYLLIKELMMVIGSTGVNIDQRHMVLLVDFMVNRGIPLSISYSGLSKQTHETLEMAAYERSTEVYAKTAAVGKKESTNSVSASIYLGQRVQLGTGAVDVVVDKEREEQLLSELRAGSMLNASEISNALAQQELLQDYEVDETRNEVFTDVPSYLRNATEIISQQPIIGISLTGGFRSEQQGPEVQQDKDISKKYGKGYQEGKEEVSLQAPIQTAVKQAVPTEVAKVADKITGSTIKLKGILPTSLMSKLKPVKKD
jgi:hypothetical protein